MNTSLPLTIRGKTPKGWVPPKLTELTPTQTQVLRAIAQTGDYKSAAASLNCAVKTVENHLVRIHKLLGEPSTVRIHKLLGEPSTVRCILLAERGGLLKGVV